MKDRLLKVLLTIVVTLSSIGGVFGTVNAHAKDIEFDIAATVELLENKTEATITFDLESVNEQFIVESIKDSEGKEINLESLTYNVLENGTYKFNINYYNHSDLEDLLTYQKEVVVNEISEDEIDKTEVDIPTIEEKEKSQEELKTSSSSNGDSLKVQFNRDNEDPIDWSDVDQINWDFAGQEQIEMTANFSEKGKNKTRKLEVNVPDGYEIIGYSAKDGTKQQATEEPYETTESTQQAMNKSVLTSQKGNAFGSEIIEGYKTVSNTDFKETQKSGKIVYEFNSEADVIILTLRLGIDRKMYNYSDGKKLYNDPIATDSAGISTGQLFDDLEVKMTSGSEQLTEKVKANVSVGYNDFYLHRGDTVGNVSSTYIDEDGKSPTITPYGSGFFYFYYPGRILSTLLDEVVITYTYPEGAEFQEIAESNFTKAGEMVVKQDDKARTVTVTYKNVYTNAAGTYSYGYPKFVLDGDVYDAEDSSKLKSALFTATLTYKAYQTDTYIADASREFRVNLIRQDMPVGVSAYGGKVYDYKAKGYDFENSYQFLGNYAVTNPSPTEKTDLNLDWTFDSGIGAKVLRCGIPAGSKLYDTKVYTTKNVFGYEIPDMVNVNGVHGTIIDGDELGFEDDEYITKVTGKINKIPEYHTGPSKIGYPASQQYAGYAVYGMLIEGTTASHTLTIDNVSDTATVSPTEDRVINNTNVSPSSIKKSYYPGETIPVSLSFNTGFNAYNREGGVITENFLQDPTIYIRVPKGFSLDESSVKLDSGQDVTTKATLTKFEKDGAEIYKYSFDDPYSVMAGYYYKNSSGTYTNKRTLAVNFNLKVAPSNQGYANLALRDVVMVEGKGRFVGFDGNSIYLRADDFGLTESGNNLFVPAGTVKTSVIKLPELKVLSGIRVQDAGTDFYNYDGSDASVASLSKDKVAEVEMKYFNNSPSNFEKASIYFPIPRTGVDYGAYFNNKAISDPLNNVESTPFTWDANLLNEVDVEGFTTYYATDGAVNINPNDGSLTWEAFKPNSDWKTYDQVKNNLDDVIFLKFVSNTTIAPEATGSFEFELQADTNSPADEVNYWRTYTGTQISDQTVQSWVTGGVLAGSLSIGELHGMVFVDKNQNGVYDAGIDVPYTGNDLKLRLTEANGAINGMELAIDTNGKFDIDMLKQGEYTISALNGSSSTQKFTISKALDNDALESNAVANTAHTEARITGLDIKAVESEKYTNIGIGLVEETSISYEFEDKIKNDTTLSGKVSLSLDSSTTDHNETLISGGFLNHKFNVPTVTLPTGYVQTGWDIYKVESGTKTLIKNVSTNKLADEEIPAASTDESYLVQAKISLPPELKLNNLNVYVGDSFDIVSNLTNYVSAKDEDGDTIVLNTTPLVGNTELTLDSLMPNLEDGLYKKAGTYGVNVKVKTTSGSYSEKELVVKVNQAPTVVAYSQEYTLGDDIDNGIKSNVSASWLKASDTVGAEAIETSLTPTYTIISGPDTSGFSKAGLYTVKYIAKNADNKTGEKEVKVLVSSDSAVTDPTATYTIDAKGFTLGEGETGDFDATKAIKKGQAVAYEYETDADGHLINIKDVTDKIVVDVDELKAIQNTPTKGGIYDLTYAIKDGNKEVSTKVNVVVQGISTSVDDDLALSAKGFTLKNIDAATLNEGDAIIKAEAKAILISDGSEVSNIKVDSNELDAIQKTDENGGIYDLTYTAKSGTMETSVSVKVVVLGAGTPPPVETEEDDQLAINAHGFALEYTEANALTADEAKIKSEVSAYLIQAQEEVTNIVVDTMQLISIQSASKTGGVYELSLTAIADDGTKNTVTVKVVVKGSSTSIDDNLALTAHGFTLDNNEAKGLNDIGAIAKGQASALLIQSGTVVTNITVNAAELEMIQKAGENGGIYDLTYTAKSGTMETSVTVKVVVLGAGTPPPVETEDDELAINAHGFALEYTEANALTADEAKIKSEVSAYLVQAQEAVTNITVDDTQLKDIQTASKAGGIYDLTFTAKANDQITNSVTVKVLVKPSGGITDATETYTIDANGFVVSYEEAKVLDADTSKTSSQAVAYKVIRDSENQVIDIIVVSQKINVDADQLDVINNVETNGGIFGLTLSVGEEGNVVSIEVPVLVQPKWNITESNVVLGVEGFILENDEAATLNKANALSHSKASAYETIVDADGNIISFKDLTDTIAIDDKELKTIQEANQKGGIYDLTYSVVNSQGKSVSRTVKVVVKGTHTPAPDGESDQLAMTANDFTIKNSEASAMTVEKAIEKAKAEAWLVKEGTLVEVKVDDKQLQAIQEVSKKGGEFDLTFMASYEIDGELVTAQITVKVTVEAEESIDDNGDVLGENTTNTNGGSENQTTVKTDDTMHLALYGSIGLISLFVVLIIIKQKKSKKTVQK